MTQISVCLFLVTSFQFLFIFTYLQLGLVVTLTTQTMPLTLPPTDPRLGKYSRYDWSLSSFALYTLTNKTSQSLQTLAHKLEEEELEKYEDEGSHLVRVAPNPDFSGKSLQDVLEAHVALLENELQRAEPYDEFCDGHLRWFPTAFIVVGAGEGVEVEEEGEGRFLFVYADSWEQSEKCPVGRFWFGVEGAHEMLESLRLGHEVFGDAEERFGMCDALG